MKLFLLPCSLAVLDKLGFPVKISDPYGYAGYIYNRAIFKLISF